MPTNTSGYPIVVSTGQDDGQGGEITRIVQPGESYELTPASHSDIPVPSTPITSGDAPANEPTEPEE